MVLLDVGDEVDHGTEVGLDPVDVLLVLLLVLLEHTVGVELAGIGHLLDVRAWLGGDGHPAESRDGLAHGGQVVEEGAAAALLAELLCGADLLRDGLEQRLHHVGGGLLALGCGDQDGTHGLVGGLDHGSLVAHQIHHKRNQILVVWCYLAYVHTTNSRETLSR